MSGIWTDGLWASGFWSPEFWQTDGLVSEPVDVGGGRRRNRRADSGRAVSGEALALGVSVVGLGAVREVVPSIAAFGAAVATVSAVRESVVPFVGAGASEVAVGVRGERVSVFSDEELFALAMWSSRRRH